MLYNIENYSDEDELINCPNCGNKGKASELIIICKLKEIYYDSKIHTSVNTYKIKVYYNDVNYIKNNNKIVKCLTCGASLDITQKNASIVEE